MSSSRFAYIFAWLLTFFIGAHFLVGCSPKHVQQFRAWSNCGYTEDIRYVHVAILGNRSIQVEGERVSLSALHETLVRYKQRRYKRIKAARDRASFFVLKVCEVPEVDPQFASAVQAILARWDDIEVY